MKRIANKFGMTLGMVSVLVAPLMMVVLTGCGSNSPKSPAPVEAGDPSAKDEDAAPAAKDPNAKVGKAVVVGGAEFNFGTTEMGQEFEHVFEVRNEGNADMHVEAGQPSCTTCTSFTIDKKIVKPGESLKATVKWHIKVPNPEFRQYAPLTIDEGQEIKLYVIGKVEKRIVVSPADRWSIGDIADGQPTEFVANITSAVLDKFDIESITTTNPALKVIHSPLSAEKLTELKVKSGFELKALLEPTIPIGEFSDRIGINVLDPKPLKIVVEAAAKRSGPIKIFGPNWTEEAATLRLGEFDPKQEFVTRLNLFTRGVEGELKIEKVVCADDRFSVELLRDAKFTGANGSGRYELIVKVAGSNRSVVYTLQQPLEVELVTNQPQVGSIKFKVRSSQLK